MKYLFIIQGEGRGHISQAIALQQIIKYEDICCILVGKSPNRELPEYFTKNFRSPVFKYQSPGFLKSINKKGIKVIFSLAYNLLRFRTYFKSIAFIAEIIEHFKPDVVVNFYEPLVGFAYGFYKIRVRHVTLGHHYMVNHPDFPLPPGKNLSKYLLKLLNRITSIKADKVIALSFREMVPFQKKNWYVAPPLIRNEIINSNIRESNFVLGYMLNEGYSEEVKMWHDKKPDVKAIFFWDKKDTPNILEINKNLHFHKIDDIEFIRLLSECMGVITTAGFETVNEAIFCGKPVVVVPVRNHYEQLCNAFDACLNPLVKYAEKYDPDTLISHIKQNPKEKSETRQWILSSKIFFVKHLT